MVFSIFGCRFVKEIQSKILLACMKSLSNFKNYFVTLVRKLVPAF
jgi:hypothetical protein